MSKHFNRKMGKRKQMMAGPTLAIIADDPTVHSRLANSLRRRGVIVTTLAAGLETKNRTENTPGSLLLAGIGLDRLMEAVATLVKQSQGASGTVHKVCHRGLALDRECLHASLDGRPLKLTPTEFRIVWALAKRPGHVVTRERLLRSSHNGQSQAHTRTVDVHIRNIRQKLASRADLIEAVRSVGYRLNRGNE